MIDGIDIKMGGETFIVPPLNFKRLRKLKPVLEGFIQAANVANSVTLTDEQLDAAVTIVHTALTRNYPDLERDKLEELLDVGNMMPVMQAIMGQSGLVRAGE